MSQKVHKSKLLYDSIWIWRHFDLVAQANLVALKLHRSWAAFFLNSCFVRLGLEEHGCHGMILPWSYHDHGETWSCSCHDNGMAALFLCMVVMIHGIMAWSWYDYHGFHDSFHAHGMIIMFGMFFWKINELFVNSFSNSWCHVPLNGTLDWL